MSDVVCDERPCPECPDCATLRTRLAEALAENERLRPLINRAFLEGHDAGYSCACAKVERPDAHGDWLVSRTRAALAQTTEKDHDDST